MRSEEDIDRDLKLNRERQAIVQSEIDRLTACISETRVELEALQRLRAEIMLKRSLPIVALVGLLVAGIGYFFYR